MCYYVMIATPVNAVEALRARGADRALLIESTANRSAIAAAGAGLTPFVVRTAPCGCGSYSIPVGASHVAEAAREWEAKRQRKREKYLKLGWSNAKIERALGAAPPPDRSDGKQGLHDAAILDLVRGVCDEFGSAEVWVHEFAGGIETEKYAIRRRARCALGQLVEQARALELDVALTVGKQD